MRTLLLILLSITAYAQDDPYLLYSQYQRIGLKGTVKSVAEYRYVKLDYDKNAEHNVTGELTAVEKKWFDEEGYITRDSTYSIVLHRGNTFNAYQDYYYSENSNTITVVKHRYYNDSTNSTDSSFTIYRQRDDSTFQYLKFNDLSHADFQSTPPDIPKSEVTLIIKKNIIQSNHTIYYHHKGVVLEEHLYHYDEDGNVIASKGLLGKKSTATNTLILSKDIKGNATQKVILKKKKPYSMTRYEIEYYE